MYLKLGIEKNLKIYMKKYIYFMKNIQIKNILIEKFNNLDIYADIQI